MTSRQSVQVDSVEFLRGRVRKSRLESPEEESSGEFGELERFAQPLLGSHLPEHFEVSAVRSSLRIQAEAPAPRRMPYRHARGRRYRGPSAINCESLRHFRPLNDIAESVNDYSDNTRDEAEVKTSLAVVTTLSGNHGSLLILLGAAIGRLPRQAGKEGRNLSV